MTSPIYQQIDDQLSLFKTALQSKEFSNLQSLLDEHRQIFLNLQQYFQEGREDDIVHLSQLLQNVSGVILEAEQQQRSISLELIKMNQKKKQIKMYLKYQ